MHEKKIDAFVSRLNNLVASMQSPEHLKLIDEHRTKRIVHDNKVLHLSEVTKPDFDDLLKKMHSEGDWNRRFSERTVRNEVFGAILAVLDGADSKAYVLAMASRIDGWHPRHRVLVPLSGVMLGAEVNIEFGRVALLQMNEELFATEISGRLPPEVAIYSGDGLFVFGVDVQEDLDKTALYAEYTVETDARKAAELADEYVAPVADYLQFCVAIINGARHTCLVDYKGRYLRKNVSPVVISNEDAGTASLDSIDDERYVRMGITHASFALLQRCGIVEIARLFGLPDIAAEDEYTQLIYRAIRVFAEGERSTSPRQKILSYVTACELFFSQKYETTRAVTEGVAFALGADYDARKVVREALIKMYEARSSATHEGFEPDNVALYRRQVLKVLLQMIRMKRLEPEKFRAKADLTAWIDRQRLSGPPVG